MEEQQGGMKMEPKLYMVLTGDMETLENKVSAIMESGYIPVGGPVMVKPDSGVWGQAVVYKGSKAMLTPKKEGK